MGFVRPTSARDRGQQHWEQCSHQSRAYAREDYCCPPSFRSSHKVIGEDTANTVIGEDNAAVFDALDVMDCVAAQIRTQADCLIMTTDDEDPECLSMDWGETNRDVLRQRLL